MCRERDGVVVWIIGPPAAGKSTLASAVAFRLSEAGYRPRIYEASDLRALVNNDRFSRAGRHANYHLLDHVAHAYTSQRPQRIAIVAACAPDHERPTADLTVMLQASEPERRRRSAERGDDIYRSGIKIMETVRPTHGVVIDTERLQPDDAAKMVSRQVEKLLSDAAGSPPTTDT